MVTLKRAGDIHAPAINILLYGESGAGKTWMAASCDNVAYLLLESNGVQSVRESNPDAMLLLAHNMDDVRGFMRMAFDGTMEKMGIKTIVIDGLTEIQRMMQDEILQQKKGNASGEVTFTLQDWGVLTDKVRQFLRTIRRAPFNVVATALASNEVEEGMGTRRIMPQFSGKKLHNEVAQFFNVVGFVYRQQVPGEGGQVSYARRAMLEGPEGYLVKPCHPLVGTLEGPVQNWLDALVEHPETSPAPAGDTKKPA